MLARVLAIAFSVLFAAGAAQAQNGSNAFDFTFDAIEGGPLALGDYRGKALLVVNTASFCGFTNQYADLQKVWDKYRDSGLVVVGVPSNDFDQESDDASTIKEFCETTFGINFPLTVPTPVTGDSAHPFYQWVRGELGARAEPQWNFHKYVIDRNGKPVAWFPSAVEPDDRRLTQAIEDALGDAPSGR